MKKLSTTLFVVFIILLSTQFIRNAYDSVFYSRHSVLDKSDKDAEINLDSSLSLKELSMIYADAEKRIKLIESGKGKDKSGKYTSGEDPYARRVKIQELILTRESNNRSITELLFFWITGIILAAGGSFLYMKSERWTGVALVISGFTEMIWITGPLFFLSRVKPETFLVLNIKLLLTALTLAAVILYWIFFRKYMEK